MARLKNRTWNLNCNESDLTFAQFHIVVALLMDIRDELQAIRARLDCHETRAIPRYRRRISANTAKPKRKKR